MSQKRVSLTIKGLEKDNGDVRLDEFIQQLDLLKKALVETQRTISDKAGAEFKVVELRHQSPAYIVLEPVANEEASLVLGAQTVEKFFTSIKQIEEGEYPEGFTYETFEAYKNLPSLVEKNRIGDIVVSQNGSKPRDLNILTERVTSIVGEDVIEYGSYEGMLEWINIHARQNVFYVYPTSTLPKLKCRFSSDLKEEAFAAIGKYVNVWGEKKYKPNLKRYFPYEMRVVKIEVLGHEDMPSLSDLKGIAPDARGDKTSEDFVRGTRDEW